MIHKNNERLKNLLQSVSSLLKGNQKYQHLIDHGPIEKNGFSLTFWANFSGKNGLSSIYIKIPKIIFGNKTIDYYSPITEFDMTLARDEFKSLNYLSKNWTSMHGVSFVETLGFIENHNAIITKRCNGSFLFKEFRKNDIKTRFNRHTSDSTKLGLLNFGKSLNYFHNKFAIETDFDIEKTLKKFDNYYGSLRKFGVSNNFLNDIDNTLINYKRITEKTLIVDNLKGIDIRQLLRDQDKDIIVIDPGKITRSYREVDLARFIVTCRILYWGTFLIPFRMRPNIKYEQAFLNGYFGSKKHTGKILHVMILKELLKHWKMSHTSLQKKGWPKFLIILLKRFYINHFYKYLILNELEELKKSEL